MHLVAELHERREHRADLLFVASAALGDRETELLMCDHTEDSQDARHVHGTGLEQQGIEVSSRALGSEVSERIRGDREQRTHRTGRVEVVAQRRVDSGLVAEEGGMQLALGYPPSGWRLLPIRIA